MLVLTTPEQNRLIREAAKISSLAYTSFVRRAAVLEARKIILENQGGIQI